MEERPTVSAVKHLIEAAHLEGGDKLASSLLPVWDAVKALQVVLGGVMEHASPSNLSHIQCMS
jgi:hypothetical protein